MELGTYALAARGAVGGVYKYYVRPELTAKRAWLCMLGLITAYELACPPGETLSEGVDKALESHKVATAALIGITALHLINVFEVVGLEKYDPFSAALQAVKRSGL